jgi:hypothetical protein
MSFNQPVIIPRKPDSPWKTVLPTLLTNLALLKVKSNMAKDIAAAETAWEKEKLGAALKAKADIARKQRMTDLTTTAMGMMGKKREPFRVIQSNGMAIGILNQATGELDRAGFGDAGIPSKYLSVSKTTNEAGDVTQWAVDDRTGKTIWEHTYPKRGRPGKTAEAITEKVLTKGQAQKELYYKSSKLIDDATSAVDKRAKTDLQFFSDMNKDPQFRKKAIIIEAGERAGIFQKYPNSDLRQMPSGEIVIVDLDDTDAQGNPRIVLDKTGVR